MLRSGLILALSTLGILEPAAQAAMGVEAGGMRVTWDFVLEEETGRLLRLVVRAPTEGWVAVGFNSVDDIVGAELVMARVVAGRAEADNRWVVAAGDHRSVTDLGMASRILSVQEGQTRVGIEMRIDLLPQVEEASRMRLERGTVLYLIVAYSVSPDFYHHSRFRRHIRIVL